MSFPISPSNNQVTLENGIAYTYNSSRGAWYRTPVTALTSVTSNNFTVLNSIIFSDGTTQTTAANPTDVYARTTANTNSTNITIIQGVNDTQNSRITVSEGVDLTQNTRLSIIEGVNTTQNTNISAVDTKAQAAFDSANTKLNLSGGIIAGNVTANSIIANNSIYAPTFYSTGATSKLDLTDIGLVSVSVASQEFKFGAAGIESSPGIYGGSFGGNKLSLNNETNLISNRYNTVKIQTGTDGTVSNTWTFSGASLLFPDGTTQNTAFDSTTFSPFDTYARTTANAAFDKANAAYELANTANTTASSGGGGGASISTSSYNYRKYQGDGSTVAFTISSGHTANTVLVFNNGVCQMPFDDYTVSATTLTYVIAPQSDETIQIRELPVA